MLIVLAVPVTAAVFAHAGNRAQVSPVADQSDIAFSTASPQSQDSADAVCPRFAEGNIVAQPPELFSQNGVLEVTLHFQSAVDAQGLKRYCWVTDSGVESPTLAVHPGDHLIIHLNNNLPLNSSAAAEQMAGMVTEAAGAAQTNDCNAQTMTATETNLHFHGLNVSPACHQDEVIHTLVQPQQTFDYDVLIPQNEPAGLYWYHPHPHGFSEAQVLGGSAGALIVEGIENFNSVVAGLPSQTFIIRDQSLRAAENALPGTKPAHDLSINYVPVTFPNYVPAVISTKPNEKQFWRVLNGSSDTLTDIQYVVNGVPQPMQLVAVDGVPLTDASGNPHTSTKTDIVIPPAGRAEFIVTTPAVGAAAQLVTATWDNGHGFDLDPGRPLANVVSSTGAGNFPVATARRLPAVTQSLPIERFGALSEATPTTQRQLYFSVSPNFSQFFITLQGQTPTAFSMDAPPNITVRSGTVEQWTVENRSPMDHSFHIHQIHFQLLDVNGSPVNDTTMRDTIDVPHWSGSGPYPSVTLLMDFRDPGIVGTFVYHCHILNHEDKGMMGAIQVLPNLTATSVSLSASPTSSRFGANVTFTAKVAGTSGSGTPTGTVNFLKGASTIGSVALNGGIATFSTNSLPAGADSITASYSGDTSFAASTSSAVSVQVSAGTTTTTLTSSANPAVVGELTTYTAAVSGSGSKPTGNVVFIVGSTTLATVPLDATGAATASDTFASAQTTTITAAYQGDANNSKSSATLSQAVQASSAQGTPLRFVAITPCRVADTRNASGPFGGPEISAQSSRSFAVPQSACGIPPTAVAYSLNVTVVPDAALNFLTVWPSGQPQPYVSTLNSLDGRIKANAAIVSAGNNGGVSVFASDAANVILDINGYFVPASTPSALAFYPLAPCRVADTRYGAGALAGPYLSGQTSREFPLLSSACGLPPNAQAYSLNITALPHSTLNHLTTWPTGQAQPLASTLNSLTGAITANAAIVPAGSGGNISIFASDDTDLILDVNGYFAPPAAGGLSLYTVAPCRVMDTRSTYHAFSGILSVGVLGGACLPPVSAQAYVLNATVVPAAPLDWLTLWASGQGQPGASTLNAKDGAITSNMAIVPTNNGAVDAFAADSTNLILDLSSYFAP